MCNCAHLVDSILIQYFARLIHVYYLFVFLTQMRILIHVILILITDPGSGLFKIIYFFSYKLPKK